MINYSLLDEAFPNDNKTKKKPKNSDDSIVKHVAMAKHECKPIQAPVYTQPSCSDNTISFQKAIETSMMANKGEIGIDGFNKDGVKAYDFDEFDAYLKVSDINTNNKDTSPEYRTTPFLMDYLKTLRNNFNQPIQYSTDKVLNIEQFTNNNLQVDVNLYNLFLFIFLGIIIIALVHQINQLVKI